MPGILDLLRALGGAPQQNIATPPFVKGMPGMQTGQAPGMQSPVPPKPSLTNIQTPPFVPPGQPAPPQLAKPLSPPQADMQDDNPPVVQSAPLTKMTPLKPQMNFPPPPASDVPEWATKDLQGDYQQQRDTLAHLPRKADYPDSKARTAIGLLGGFAANLAAGSPLWYARAGAPQLAKLSSKIENNQPYNKAMQNWNENQAIAQGQGQLSTQAATTQDKLATGATKREVDRANTEYLRQRPNIEQAKNETRLNVGMIDLNDAQARLVGYSDEDIAAAKDAGIPLRAHRQLVANAEKVQTQAQTAEMRQKSWEGIKTKIAEMQQETARDKMELQREISAALEEGRNSRAAKNNDAAMARTQVRSSTSRQNTQDIIRAKEQSDKNSYRAEKLKQDGMARLKTIRDKEMSIAGMHLGNNPATGKPYTLDELKERAKTDAVAGQQVISYKEAIEKAEREYQEQSAQLNEAYRGLKGVGGDEAPATPTIKVGTKAKNAQGVEITFDGKQWKDAKGNIVQ